MAAEERKEAVSPSGFPRIFLARHCKTSWNLEKRIQGRTDIPLCEEGIAEAKANCVLLRDLPIDRILSSPLARGRQTAEIYGEALGVPIEAWPEWIEVNMGEWEGHTPEELSLREPGRYDRWLADPSLFPLSSIGGEDIWSARKRVASALCSLAGRPERGILLVLHKYIRAILQCAVLDLPLSRFAGEIIESTAPSELPPLAVRNFCR
ncbi:Adenosylcobalamin/alpha-ribazole phosphatase [Methylacidimicrobium cyclopophantes]|uniref:Adenosylcobalamin/alpha-ribazole phosphatase n=1 Tax=Methylacidimicrobium cyclopophantes TaxID=1041766 RepID=A0A5E6MIR4_9BACT|nr:histidine phosphatase family protein [Methylacidimicrobium cyclopophantes]VVM05391.1 Adenosylcobalamin/alpha-ribazole phosphatase [Methylacidimicrobium cyclopophantes]